MTGGRALSRGWTAAVLASFFWAAGAEATLACGQALSQEERGAFDRMAAGERVEAGQAGAAAPEAEAPTVYLTFDDGPSRLTEQVLDILRDEGVPATFFVVGSQAEEHPDVVRRAAAEGHAVGNHSYDHRYESLYPEFEDFWEQVRRTSDILERTIGHAPALLRAPGGTSGNFSPFYFYLLEEAGYRVFDWNVDSGDASRRSVPSAEIVRRAVPERPPREALVLLHDGKGHEETVKALPAIIRAYKDCGYRFAKLDERVKPVQFRPAKLKRTGKPMTEEWFANLLAAVRQERSRLWAAETAGPSTAGSSAAGADTAGAISGGAPSAGDGAAPGHGASRPSTEGAGAAAVPDAGSVGGGGKPASGGASAGMNAATFGGPPSSGADTGAEDDRSGSAASDRPKLASGGTRGDDAGAHAHAGRAEEAETAETAGDHEAASAEAAPLMMVVVPKDGRGAAERSRAGTAPSGPALTADERRPSAIRFMPGEYEFLNGRFYVPFLRVAEWLRADVRYRAGGGPHLRWGMRVVAVDAIRRSVAVAESPFELSVRVVSGAGRLGGAATISGMKAVRYADVRLRNGVLMVPVRDLAGWLGGDVSEYAFEPIRTVVLGLPDDVLSGSPLAERPTAISWRSVWSVAGTASGVLALSHRRLADARSERERMSVISSY